MSTNQSKKKKKILLIDKDNLLKRLKEIKNNNSLLDRLIKDISDKKEIEAGERDMFYFNVLDYELAENISFESKGAYAKLKFLEKLINILKSGEYKLDDFYFRKNHNEIQFDDNFNIFVFIEEWNMWLSIFGNYSFKSPFTKYNKYCEYLQNKKEWYEQSLINANEKFEENHKWSLIRQEVLKRDNYECQVCGIKLKVLDVHHIIPRKAGGEDYYDNLISVCSSCHKKIEYKDYKSQDRSII